MSGGSDRHLRQANGDPRLPVTILTGYLGAGKTTCLNAFLATPEAAGSAVVVNEFGEIDVDGAVLAGQLGNGADLLRLPNGCVCCEVQEDLAQALLHLAARGGLRRCIVETSGLAVPGAILRGLHHDPDLRRAASAGPVLAVCAADRIARQLDRFPEVARQIALADRILLRKTDLATAETAAGARAAISALNPFAAITLPGNPAADFAPPRVARRAPDAPGNTPDHGQDDHGHGDHGHGIGSFTVRFDRPLDPDRFRDSMSFLILRHADNLLRAKGILHFDGDARGHLVNIVHDVYDSRPIDADAADALVFIGCDLPADAIRTDLLSCRIAATATATATRESTSKRGSSR
ncbi:hypothetical protein GE300_16775 [Rhodobacteraceae bacterium 2CG4]|uniref:CobW C-terminal domain-containing protein n=1 Tax=Halovulum marinum TaxID=2662447 RepID=A0A6L5Z3W3_9RHOB|nr:GTP-binding protein [Halovulum marinum]MSU91238.1 hypothetical protein [Halovulum marinum]